MRTNVVRFLALLVVSIAILGAIQGERALIRSGVYESTFEARFNDFISGSYNKSLSFPSKTISPPRGDIPVCFVVCIFGKSVASLDKVQPVRETKLLNHSSYNFFAYTNLPDWKVEGWTPVVKSFPQYRRFITQSRWPKFQAWKDPEIKEKCKVVFYMDSISNIKGTPDQFQEMAREILESKVGLAQYPHRGGGGAMKEFWRVARVRKDLPENIAASKAWLLNQSDFRANCTLYENRYFAYAVESPHFQQASDFLWNHYSLEQDSWRDQPLWCYTLDHYDITPIYLNHTTLFGISLKRMTKIHKYSKKSDGDATQWANKTEQ
eukprot:scaffold345_cov134-Cylindrotheca_fusiformis.AAC.53